MTSPGDPVTRTTTSGPETVLLPAINFLHLTQIQVDGRIVKGFHVLPSGVIITSRAAALIATGTVAIVDRAGVSLAGAVARITPQKLPTSPWDTLEARVEVLDAGGVVIASADKVFFPEAWTIGQVQEAIYAAFTQAYQSGQTPPGLLAGVTPGRVRIDLRVKGTFSAAGARLKEITTAYPKAGQTLTASEQP